MDHNAFDRYKSIITLIKYKNHIIECKQLKITDIQLQ